MATTKMHVWDALVVPGDTADPSSRSGDDPGSADTLGVRHNATAATVRRAAVLTAAVGDVVQQHVLQQTNVCDKSEVFTGFIILSCVCVAAACGVAAFTLHLSVNLAGCFGGVNGCNSMILYDLLEPLGVNRSVYFIVSSALSGLVCSLIIYSPCGNGVAKKCKGGGSAGTKIAISAGKIQSIWIVVLRIVLASLYMGGGNTLGTEGPIIHLSATLGTFLAGLAGAKRRKLLSLFGVVGAAAGISAGFNVLITGFVYTIEELTRTLSRKFALVVTLAAAVAIFVKDKLESLLELWFHVDHTSLVPKPDIWEELTMYDIHLCLLLCLPIGVLNGVAGWAFTRLAWAAQGQLSRIPMPEIFHLAIIGLITGCLGAIAYEVTGVNGVWGTTAGAIPEAVQSNLSWQKVLLLFLAKFASFILATAGGGPGGLLVPSLVAGGFMGLAVGRIVGGSEALSSGCAVVGMAALFSSVMHLPVTGVIIVFEITQARALILHVAVVNFISSNVTSRLPSGSTSFVHLSLHRDPTWLKIGGQDFIETDDHEKTADTTIGPQRLNNMNTSALKDFFLTDQSRMRRAFHGWSNVVVKLKVAKKKFSSLHSRHSMSSMASFRDRKQTSFDRVVRQWLTQGETVFMRRVWSAWCVFLRREIRLRINNGFGQASQVTVPEPNSGRSQGSNRSNGRQSAFAKLLPHSLLG